MKWRDSRVLVVAGLIVVAVVATVFLAGGGVGSIAQGTPTPDTISQMELVRGDVPADVALSFGIVPEQSSETAVDINPACASGLYALVASGTDLILACVTDATPEPTPEPSPTAVPPTPTPIPNDPVEPYAGAPFCEDVGVAHPEGHHGDWQAIPGCWWDHEHGQDPTEIDDVFGTDAYEWIGGELAPPWMTFHGAGANFEEYMEGMCTENSCKHEGYGWYYVRDRNTTEYIRGSLVLGVHAITDARVLLHAIGGQTGALTTYHSFWLEARACREGDITDCGIIGGGGWLDFGRLNWPERGTWYPLPNDPPAYAELAPEKAPYRIHAVGRGSLDSWQSEGNWYNCLPDDPDCNGRIWLGFGVHLPDSPGDTDPTGLTDPIEMAHCIDASTLIYTCELNSSVKALFRVWASVPQWLDGSIYDEDGAANGYVTYNLFTNRYGDIVDGCTAVGLDCVPAYAENFPVGDCPNDRCKSAYRGSIADAFDGETKVFFPDGTQAFHLRYPN